MEETQGFYKNDNGTLLYGPNFILNSNYELRKETKSEAGFGIIPLNAECGSLFFDETLIVKEIIPL